MIQKTSAKACKTLKQRPSTMWLTEIQKAVYSQFWSENATGLLGSLLQVPSWAISCTLLHHPFLLFIFKNLFS